MKTIDLNGTWRLTGDGYDLEAKVPGSVISALLDAGEIADPYQGNNEEAVQPIFDHDYTFSRTFALEEADLAGRDRVFLRCDGLDTICQISVNGVEVAQTENMHRQYRLDVRELVRPGENTVSLLFRSPVEYMKHVDSPLGKAFVSMRKAHCMFGWDWGIRLPDSGIWRDISLELVDSGRILDVMTHQEHGGDGVRLDLSANLECYEPGLQLSLSLRDPEGEELFRRRVEARARTEQSVQIADPRLWWPAGYGEQPLYCVTVQLEKDGRVLDVWQQSVGLRTVSLFRGENNVGDYRFSVNGTPIYVKGANIIIEDAVISRTTRERWDKMIRGALLANYNALRVWGGAYYPPDYFFQLCDRYGILVYQDFMFACRFYWPSEEFLATVREEVAQNVIRLRSHPSLCMWCGNNEADFFYTVFVSDEPETVAFLAQFGGKPYDEEMSQKVRWLYHKTFQEVIPEIVERLSPDVGYIHSSPSAGDQLGAKSMLDYFDKGDSHYYHHANSDAPYRKLSGFHIRFLSEFGFQSYPSLKTLREYLPEAALSPYSKEMLVHQKSIRGNETIELYLSRDFFVPKDFPHYVYMSQMMAGEILRYTVEHMRRDRDYSRGILLWQHNDCWPVVSWAGVDYRGRWKGQQYYAKRFFAPVLASAQVQGDRADVFLINDRTAPVDGRLEWTLYRGRKAVSAGSRAVELPAASTGSYGTAEAAGAPLDQLCLLYAFCRGKEIVSRGSQLFVEQREFAFERPTLRLRLRDEGAAYRLTLTADCFVKSLCLDFEEGDGLFSDNYFDLGPDAPYEVTVDKGDLSGISDGAQLRRQLTLMCVNDVACGPAADGPAILWEEDSL